MDYKALMATIRQKKIAPIYLLHGEEAYLIRQLERAIVDSVVAPSDRDMNLILFETDPRPEELAAAIETIPFLGERNLIIVRNTSLFSSGRKGSGDEEQAKNDPKAERLISLFANVPEYSRVVFISYDKPDKRRKIYKAIEKSGIIFESAPLKARDLRPWLLERLAQDNIKMASDAQEHLLAAVSLMPQISLDFINNELDKVVLYTTGQPVITRKALEEIMAAVPEVSIFAMIDALSLKQTGSALALLREQLAAGEVPLRILALLARQVRMLWQAKELVKRGLGGREIAESLKVPSFIGEKVAKQSRTFTEDKLKRAMQSMAAADRDLKLSKTDAVALEKIIVELCG